MKKDWDYYRRLVTTEYRFAPKYISMLKAITRFGLEVDSAAAEIVKAFDIDSAVGTQLDTLGVILGVDRLLTFEPSLNSPVLDDEMYRLVLKCKIIKNHWDGTKPSLYAVWADIFPELLALQIQDLQDMSFNIANVGNEFSVLKLELICNGYIIPKPAGVRINELRLFRECYGDIHYAMPLSIARVVNIYPKAIDMPDMTKKIYYGMLHGWYRKVVIK